MEVYLNSIEMGNGYMALRQQQNIGIEKMPRFDTIQAAGIAAILPNPRKFTATSSSSYINNRRKNYACDANSREDKILIYILKRTSTLLDGSYCFRTR
jgi:hypothetical protein